jgi:hypothetical protein
VTQLATVWSVTSNSQDSFTISAKVAPALGGDTWWLTIVYGPPWDGDKLAFLMELCDLLSQRTGPWLLTRDINLIY